MLHHPHQEWNHDDCGRQRAEAIDDAAQVRKEEMLARMDDVFKFSRDLLHVMLQGTKGKDERALSWIMPGR